MVNPDRRFPHTGGERLVASMLFILLEMRLT